eukprot:TRINITY_DN4106_c0_g4_i1.p1 TRINITY_DN4106_c0_g4~~TRINITY_DN4106_c0_g4_i1.p1  ORF type:complete len:650 (+),score=74.82 TRINITY_DN4106_c0_g4_i1:42-1991(+)
MAHTEAPKDCGALLYLDQSSTSFIQFEKDVHLSSIHPNLHVPSSLHDVVLCSGGGSGVVVVKGKDRHFGDVVLKHGSHRDTQELFALVTVALQLQERGKELQAKKAADDMRARIPEKVYAYISPFHLREVQKTKTRSRVAKSVCIGHGFNDLVELEDCLQHRKLQTVITKSRSCQLGDAEVAEMIFGRMAPISVVRERRDIRVRSFHDAGQQNVLSDPAIANDEALELFCDVEGVSHTQRIQSSLEGAGVQFSSNLFESLTYLQQAFSWKITLAQRAIGGCCPTTASSLLYNGALEGDLLDALMKQFLVLVRNLQCLTFPHERERIEIIRSEYHVLSSSAHSQAEDLSRSADEFVGFAIKKNFAQPHGRFRILRGMGSLLRSGALILSAAEKEPGQLLGKLLRRGVRMEEVFLNGPKGAMALETRESSWLELLERAVTCTGEASSCIWNCGLTDSGLHNMFLAENGLWAFDLGEPSAMPLPAFLTKFLMSFFHVLGMEEGSNGQWVNRFEVPESTKEYLSLTERSKWLLSKAHASFGRAYATVVRNLFGCQPGVCQLLVDYVVLQLLSDAAFCLEKWKNKGGGVKSTRPAALEKWLWRVLWDLYVATYVSSIDWMAEIKEKTYFERDGRCCFEPFWKMFAKSSSAKRFS